MSNMHRDFELACVQKQFLFQGKLLFSSLCFLVVSYFFSSIIPVVQMLFLTIIITFYGNLILN